MAVKIYFGGADSPTALSTLAQCGAKRIMLSFARPPSKRCWMMIRDYNPEVALDSGAFSAWMRGAKICLDDYVRYIKRHDIRTYFNFDVVGDYMSSAANHVKMEQQGLRPVPVFHFGQPWSVLRLLVKKHSLVGLGGTVGRQFHARRRWLEQVFSRHPTTRFHGLGITDQRLLRMFPFASVDSSWWLYRFRDKQRRLAPGGCRRAEQKARVRHLLDLEQAEWAYQQALTL